MNGSELKKQELVELLKARGPADQASKIEAAVTGMADEIRDEVAAEMGASLTNESVREEIVNLTEARDTAVERARNAENELGELRESIDSQIEAAKEAVREEYQESVDKLHEQLDQAEIEKDQIAAQIREDSEQAMDAFKGEVIQKVSRYMDGKLNGAFDRLKESVASDPTALHESAALRQISEIIGTHLFDETAAGVEDGKVAQVNEEVVGLRAQVRQLEVRNARLMAENKVIREDSQDSIDKGRTSLKEAPTYSGKAEHKPTPALADKDGNAETGDQYEPEGNVKRHQYKTGDAAKNDKAQTKKESASDSERVRDLLSEAFNQPEESGKAQNESAGWISNVKESRQNRSERASEVEGQGLGIQTEDIIREDTGTQGKRLDENVIVPGTSTTRREFAQLSGISENAE
jgi:regulator of replication initiation timing